MDLGIEGKVALVCGGTKGIGREIAKELVLNGAKVLVVARGQAGIDETVAELRGLGGVADGFSADLTQAEKYAGVAAAACAALGPPDIAVYNMVAPGPGSFAELSDADFARAFHLTVTCFSNMVRAVIGPMKDKGWGRIVTIGSGTVKQPIRKSSAGFDYALANTTRIAAVGLSKTIAAEVAAFGITVNTIGTGSIGTEQFFDFFRDQARRSNISFEDALRTFTRAIPMGRPGRPDEVAALCAFLCSHRAGFTTGETILCDGGQVEAMM